MQKINSGAMPSSLPALPVPTLTRAAAVKSAQSTQSNTLYQGTGDL